MMVEDPDNITLRYLRRLDEKFDRLATSLAEIAHEVRALNAQCAAFLQRAKS